FVILCRSEAKAQQALALVQQWTAAAGLRLHPEKTRIIDATKHGGFDFLGYHFERGYKWPRKKSLKKFRDKIRVLTKRNNGQSLQVIISRVNRVTEAFYRMAASHVHNANTIETPFAATRLLFPA